MHQLNCDSSDLHAFTVLKCYLAYGNCSCVEASLYEETSDVVNRLLMAFKFVLLK